MKAAVCWVLAILKPVVTAIHRNPSVIWSKAVDHTPEAVALTITKLIYTWPIWTDTGTFLAASRSIKEYILGFRRKFNGSIFVKLHYRRAELGINIIDVCCYI